MKKIISVLCLIMMLTLITGCGGTKESGSKSKGNCEVFECVEKIFTNFDKFICFLSLKIFFIYIHFESMKNFLDFSFVYTGTH